MVDAIDPLVALRPDLRESLAAPVQRVLALLLSLAQVAGDADRRTDVKRHQVFAAVAQLAALAARERGAVMALEDLHAADFSTLLLAHYLSRAARDAPLLIAMTARQGEASPELERVRAGLREQRLGVEVVLRPLAGAAVARIAEGVAARPLGAGTVDAVVAAAAGNPFFAAELAATVDEGGGVRVPEHVNDLLEARLDRLPEDSRSVIRIAGALQDAFSLADLAAVADVDRADAEAAVAAGLRAASSSARTARSGSVTRSCVTRRAGASTSNNSSRCTCAPRRSSVRAAARPSRSPTTFSTPAAAARRAATVGAYGDGQRWAEQALAHAGEGDRFDLLVLIADLRHAAGDRRAAGTYAAAAELAPPELRTDLGIRRAHALTAVGEPAAASAVLRGLTAATPSQGGRLAVARGITAWYAGDLADARRQADRAAPSSVQRTAIARDSPTSRPSSPTPPAPGSATPGGSSPRSGTSPSSPVGSSTATCASPSTYCIPVIRTRAWPSSRGGCASTRERPARAEARPSPPPCSGRSS